jgi:hypothetical protein
MGALIGRFGVMIRKFVKTGFALAMAPVWLMLASAFGSEDVTLPYYTWDSRSMPIVYYVNGDDAALWPEGAGAIIRSFMSWERIPGTHVRFQYAGTTDGKTAQDDGRNIVTWVREGWPYGRDTVAFAVLWVSRGGWKIVGVDILLNAEDFTWSTDGDTTAMDVQDVLVHEIGHALGLEHSISSTEVTMFPVIVPGETRKRTIHEEEQGIIRSIYPTGRTRADTFALSGSEETLSAERAVTGYPSPQGDGRIFFLTRVDADGQDGLDEIATVQEENGKLAFYLFSAIASDDPPAEPLAYDAWSIPQGNNLVDITALDIDGDGRQEIGVLRARSDGAYVLNVYDTPYGVTEADAQPWVWRQTLRVADGDNLVAIMGLNYDREPIDEIGVVRLTPRGNYFLDVYYIGQSDGESQRIASIALPGFVGFVDMDVCDLDEDGQWELMVLFGDNRGWNISAFELPDATSPGIRPQARLVATLPISLPVGRTPMRVSSLRIAAPDGFPRPAICILTGENR